MTENTIVSITMICIGSGLALLFVVGGGFMIYLSRRNQKKADASLGWPSTTGTILETKAIRDYHSGAEDDIHVVTYSPKLKYTYRIDGIDYSSDKIAFGYGKKFNTEMAALQSIQGYPQGGLVKVYYNPGNPNEAVLERKADKQIWGVIGGVLLMVLGLCSACPMIIIGLFFATGN
jgi:hypothetical protein